MGFTELDKYMSENVNPEDILLAKYYARYARFYEEPKFAHIHETSYDESLIKNNESGWIVIDETRYWSYREKLLQKNFYLGETKIEYRGEFPDPISGLSNYVWYWDNMP